MSLKFDRGGKMSRKAYLVVIGVLLIALASIAQADNLALTGIASESSTMFPGIATAYAAIDGNTNGTFGVSVTHTDAVDNVLSWWMVDLQATYPINDIFIWNRTDAAPIRLSNFNVSVLDSSSQVVWDADYFTDRSYYPDPSFDIPLPSNTTGEFVKVTLNYLNGDHYLSLAEVEVFGDPTPVPLPPGVWLFGSGLVGLTGLRRFRRS
jgi:hypothetical protein